MITNFRRCLSCRRTAAKGEFWRVVRVYPDQQVQLDQGMGRSAYLCPRTDCLTAAKKKNRLGRSLKARIPDHIYNQLGERLIKDIDKPDKPEGDRQYSLESATTNFRENDEVL